MRCRLLSALVLVGCLAIVGSAGAEKTTLRGRVVKVIDGDSIVLESQGEKSSIRLSEIDAPERDQPYGPESKRALQRLAHGREARIVVIDRDRYGRWVGDVWVGEMRVNYEMVRQGHAWAYTRYAKSTAIVELEDEARREGRGLWRLDPEDRQAPWQWRRRERAPSSDDARPTRTPDPIVCGSKTRCKQMNDCEEARAYLLECGSSRLDGDGDGVPCEKLCR
jgi:endonuclease YncB( thermonuclease family)